MKKLLTLLIASSLVSLAQANDVQLIVQKVNNNGAVAGDTYRVFAQMPEVTHSLHIVFGDMQNPLTIESTAPFYQHEYGGNSAVNLSDAAMQTSVALQYDSYITVGYSNSTDNGMWDIGVDFTDFNEGQSILVNNGGWFMIPTDAKCTPDASGLVLIAQFTTTGVVTGTLNLQGWTSPQQVWQKKGLTFTTTQAQTFGCTDAAASNYSAEATFNDGTCHFDGGNQEQQAVLAVSESKEAVTNSWEIFPNPLRDNLIHVQFKTAIDFRKVASKIEILDMTGKLIVSQMISADSVVGGNRITLTQDLANGSYKVVLTQANKQETQTLVVQK